MTTYYQHNHVKKIITIVAKRRGGSAEMFDMVWNTLYRHFRKVHHINIKLRANNRGYGIKDIKMSKGSILSFCEKSGFLRQLLQVAERIFSV